MPKLLLFLPSQYIWSRVARRMVVIFLLAGFSSVITDLLQNSGNYVPDILIPILTAILAGIDKALREIKNSNLKK